MISDIMEDNAEYKVADYFFGDYINIGVKRLIQDSRHEQMRYFDDLLKCNEVMYENKQPIYKINIYYKTRLFSAYENRSLFKAITNRMTALYEGLHDALR